MKVYTEVQMKIKLQFIFNKIPNGFQFMTAMEVTCALNF